MKNINIPGYYRENGVDPKAKIAEARSRGAAVLSNYSSSENDRIEEDSNKEVFRMRIYGKPFDRKNANTSKKIDKGYFEPDGEKEIVGHVSETFSVNDDWDGINAVAEACGYGHSYLDEMAKEKFGRFEHPGAVLLTIGCKTWGYREVTGGVVEAYVGNVSGEADFDSWDIYELKPGMDDGGITVQSSSSGSMVEAQKEGGKWDITLTMPQFEDGSVYNSGIYASCFKNARSKYENAESAE